MVPPPPPGISAQTYSDAVSSQATLVPDNANPTNAVSAHDASSNSRRRSRDPITVNDTAPITML